MSSRGSHSCKASVASSEGSGVGFLLCRALCTTDRATRKPSMARRTSARAEADRPEPERMVEPISADGMKTCRRNGENELLALLWSASSELTC